MNIRKELEAAKYQIYLNHHGEQWLIIRVPFLALSGVGKLKSAIVELGEEPSTTIDEIRKSLDNPPIDPMDPTASTVVRGLLSQFANVDVHDEPSVQRQKKDNLFL